MPSVTCYCNRVLGPLEVVAWLSSVLAVGQVWYGVPAHASSALEVAMKDALPDLFEAAPDLMYSLVTMVSPTNLQVGKTHPQASNLLDLRCN